MLRSLFATADQENLCITINIAAIFLSISRLTHEQDPEIVKLLHSGWRLFSDLEWELPFQGENHGISLGSAN